MSTNNKHYEKRFKQSLPLISTKRTTTSSQIIGQQKKIPYEPIEIMVMTLGQAQQCAWVKLTNGIPTIRFL
jgi:hypothetical protein